MSRFEKGMEVICIADVEWDEGYGPKKGDVTTVIRFGYFRNEPITGRRLKNHFWLAFKQWDDIGENGLMNAYAAKYFRPLVSDEILSEQLEQVAEPFTVSR